VTSPTRAIIVQRRLDNEQSNLDELRNLAISAEYSVVDQIEQVRKQDLNYQIGSGKAKELAELVGTKKAEKVIFYNELKSLQAYNLAKETGVEVIDRFQLILEIFARRASTTEAKMQIELAKLHYELPRAKDKVKLAKRGEQPGFMGLGAYQVDLYYKALKRQIHHLRSKLRNVGGKRRLHRARRLELGYFNISLAGYTNAGKSSLFNMLTKETVPVGIGLFTTLSTVTRAINLFNKKVLLTDTVGFIDRLPLTLIEAFHSTLEETVFSDLILLVVDLSEPKEEIERKLIVCLDTIKTIGAINVPLVTVLNKIDLLEENELQQKVTGIKGLAPNPVLVSAIDGTNLLSLKKEVMHKLTRYVKASFLVPTKADLTSFTTWLFGHAEVQMLKYEDDCIHGVFEAIPWFAEKVRERVMKLDGTFQKI
jgi:GTP-binding protein HflX